VRPLPNRISSPSLLLVSLSHCSHRVFCLACCLLARICISHICPCTELLLMLFSCLSRRDVDGSRNPRSTNMCPAWAHHSRHLYVSSNTLHGLSFTSVCTPLVWFICVLLSFSSQSPDPVNQQSQMNCATFLLSDALPLSRRRFTSFEYLLLS
jgi:hypothetical protein